jgi:hypothetical protein
VFVSFTLKLIEVKNESKQVGVVDNNLSKNGNEISFNLIPLLFLTTYVNV